MGREKKEAVGPNRKREKEAVGGETIIIMMEKVAVGPNRKRVRRSRSSRNIPRAIILL